MGKTSFNSTSDLMKSLTEKIDDLNSGRLSIADLDQLVGQCQALYEQLVILRFKAFDTLGEPSTEEVVIKEEPTIVQTELEKEETVEIEEIPFDFSGITSTADPLPVVQNDSTTTVQPEPAPESSGFDKSTKKTEELRNEDKADENSNSLNDIFKKEEDQSLRKIFQNSPITDIKSQITIGKKFEYISSMFNGNASEYEEAIDFLNTAANGNEAQLKINELTEKYKWDLEDKSIIKFIELVERRYL